MVMMIVVDDTDTEAEQTACSHPENREPPMEFEMERGKQQGATNQNKQETTPIPLIVKPTHRHLFPASFIGEQAIANRQL